MSQFIKFYKKQLLKNFFKIPVWVLKIIFPLRRLKIRGSKIDFQSYAYIPNYDHRESQWHSSIKSDSEKINSLLNIKI